MQYLLQQIASFLLGQGPPVGWQLNMSAGFARSCGVFMSAGPDEVLRSSPDDPGDMARSIDCKPSATHRPSTHDCPSGHAGTSSG